MIEAIIAQAKPDFDGTYVTGMGQDIGNTQMPVRLVVADPHAAHDDVAYLAVNHFLRSRKFFVERSGKSNQFEGGARLINVADRVVLERIGFDGPRQVGV